MKTSLTGKRAMWFGIGAVSLGCLIAAIQGLKPGSPSASDDATAVSTATIVRTTLLDARTQSGTLGFGNPSDVPFISNERSGIVTWMAPEGSIVSRGEPLFAIDGQPVILMYGELPLFRSLRFVGQSFAEFEWLELNNARDDVRKAELSLALQNARLAEAKVKLNETLVLQQDSQLDEPVTPPFVRSMQAVDAARARLRRIEQLHEAGFTTPAELEQARYETAAANADLDATRRDSIQLYAAAQTAVADAQLAQHQAERALRDAQDVQNTLLSSDNANADIALLQENLAALGYNGAADAVIRHWQTQAGRSASGLIEPGQVVVASGAVRIAEHLAKVGDVVFSGQGQGNMPANNMSDLIVRYTSTQRMVNVPLGIADHDYARPGDSVMVTLPTDVEIPGVISDVSTVFDAQGMADTEIAIPDQEALGTLEAASVDVEFVVGRRTDVLAVPVTALLALPDGRFGVEIVTNNSTRTVAVSTGLFARGNVEISGPDIVEGLAVRIP